MILFSYILFSHSLHIGHWLAVFNYFKINILEDQSWIGELRCILRNMMYKEHYKGDIVFCFSETVSSVLVVYYTAVSLYP